MKIELTWPRRGAGNPTQTVKNPADFAPPGTLRNIIPVDFRAKGRRRPATRPGMVKATPARVGASAFAPFQGGKVVERASAIVGTELVNCRTLETGTSGKADSIFETATNMRYNAYIRGVNGDIQAMLNEIGQANPNLSYNAAFGLLGDPAQVSGVTPAFGCAFSPDGLYAFVLSIFPINTGTVGVPVAGPVIWSISKFDRNGNPVAAFGSFESQVGYSHWGDYAADLSGSIAGDSYPNEMIIGDEYIAVVAGKKVYIMRADSGRRVHRFEIPEAEEVTGVAAHTNGRLVIGFNGRQGTIDKADDDGSTDEDPNVSSGDQRRTGFYWRSGAGLLSVANDVGITVPGTVLAQVQYGVKRTDTGASDYEDSNKTFRIYEKSRRQPSRGCIVNAIATDADGALVIARTSHGWGRTDSQPPSDDMPPVTVCKIGPGTSSAVLLWETDVGAIRAERKWGNTLVSAFTVHNDIPSANDAVNTVADPHPTVDAICVDSNGDVYCAGRKLGDTNPFNIWKLNGATGQVIWSAALSAAADHWVNQACLRFNAVTGTLFAAGMIEDAGTEKAHLWEVSTADGSVISEQDLGVEVTAYGLATSVLGETLVAIGKAYA